VPNVSDPEEAVQMLGTTATVTFRDFEGNVILDGKDVERAEAVYEPNQTTGIQSWIIQMKLSGEGREKFQAGTMYAAQQSSGNNYVAIMLDEDEFSRPNVDAKYSTTGIDTDTPIIIELGSADAAEAKYYAEIIRAGALPFALRDVKLQAVGAQLGEKSLDNAILAGIIGIALVMLYMLIMYRLPGLIADIALLVYITLFLVTMSSLGINLTLPGIAGLVLTVGMAVDANIIIYERLREELRAGRTLRAAIDSGFRRAFTAIFDGNLTTLIAAAVLLWQGTGTILGFAKTLLSGVILSMICMLIVPRLLLKAFAELGATKLGLYMPKPKEKVEGAVDKPLFPFAKKIKLFGPVSIVLAATAVIGLVLLPTGTRIFNLDHDFVGGVTLNIEIGQEVTNDITNNVSNITRETSGVEPSSVTKSGDSGTAVSIKMTEIDTVKRDAVTQAVADAYGADSKNPQNSSDYVSASVGRDITRSAFVATLLAAALILIYIAIRFELKSGVAAIIALIHDVLVVLSFYVWFQIPMNMNFIAAILTVVGYSINATIVIFDRVRENWKKGGAQGDFGAVVDKSVKQTLKRSIGTTITTLLPLLMVIILGVSSVQNFGIPIAIGLVVGCYSSVFISAPLWSLLKGKTGKVR
jgi:SecD/SecF fusion protein